MLVDTSPLLSSPVECKCGWKGTTNDCDALGCDDGYVYCPSCRNPAEVNPKKQKELVEHA